MGLRRIADLPDLKGRIELSAGSTLELFNSEPLELETDTVYVNGREFQGSQNALAGRGAPYGARNGFTWGMPRVR